MPSCCVTNCSNTSMKVNRENGDISFHLFPKDPDLKNKWILATGKKNWFPTKHSSICSVHFHSADFNDTKKSRRLSQLACPTIDVWKTGEDEEVSDSAPSSPGSEQLEECVQPSIVKKLQKQQTRLLAALKLQKMKVKRFREQNRRKDKKIDSLHNVIFELKKKLLNRDEVIKIEEVIVDIDNT